MPRSSQSAAGGEDGVGVGHAAQRAEREDVLVLDSRGAAAGRGVDVLAADRARGAAVARDEPQLVQLLRGELRRALEGRGAEVARGQRVDRVEGEEVGERAELAVLGGGGAEGAGAEVARGGEHLLGVRDRRLDAGAPHGDRLDVLRAQHRAEPAAARVAAVVRDGRVLDEPLAGRADGGDAPGGAEVVAEALLGLRGGESPQPRRGQDARTVAVDDQNRRAVGGAADDDRVVARELARDREVGRRECIVQQAGERRLRDDRELRARGERRADERREDERERRLGSERIDARRARAGA